MKTINFLHKAETFSVSICSMLTILASGALAQTSTSNTVPTVIIAATDPNATWAGKPGTFSVFRLGNPEPALNVYCCIGGTATNGVDYQTIGSFISLPSGVLSNSVTINPTNRGQTYVATVDLELCPSPLLNPVNYIIGSPSNAVVYISPANFRNLVTITAPPQGAVFYTPTNIPIAASISYLGNPIPVTNVEFFANGTNDLGRGALGISSGFSGTVFLTWSNPPPGNYALTAVLGYQDPFSVTSAPVDIAVLPGPPTNLPPVVKLVMPTNGESFQAPADIEFLAKASDPDGAVTNVEFFAGTNDLGAGHILVLDPPGVNGVVGPVYYLDWPNVPAGAYGLTAVATDNGGASTVSPVVNILVRGPVTNFPPIVRITSPPNGSVFRAPLNLPIYAYAADLVGTITSVQFFANSNSLGFGHLVVAVPPPLPPGPVMPQVIIVEPSNYWELTWTNPPPETNAVLTAEATDDRGATTVSPPVVISILPPLPPPTNRPPAVGIVATDPIAIEGTNCWPWLSLANPVPDWSNWGAPAAVFRWMTNCGPKDATFTVFRNGATNDDLAVAYAIGGTATNGVDYVALPGTVSIPAGKLTASIAVVPLDEPVINKTVVLTISPGTNYVVGRPPAAAAIILDSRFPRATTGLLPGNLFQLSSTGPDGAWFHVDCSTDLVNWTPLCTNQVINGQVDFVDPGSAGQPQRFYRAVPLAGPPGQ